MRYLIPCLFVLLGCRGDDCCRGADPAVAVRVAMAYAAAKTKVVCECGRGGPCICGEDCRCPDCPANCPCKPKAKATYVAPPVVIPSFGGGVRCGG